MLSLAEPEEIMRFHDKGLVATVAAALHAVQTSHEAAIAMGVRPTTGAQDPFESTMLLGAFSAKCLGRPAKEDTSCVALKTSTLALYLQPQFLESEEIFDE